MIRNATFAGVGSTRPTALIASILTLCLPSPSRLVNGDEQDLNFLPSRLHLNVEPGTVERNLIFTYRLVDTFAGFFFTMVSGTGHAAWVAADCGHASWVTSP